jgi:hypothetical protein
MRKPSPSALPRAVAFGFARRSHTSIGLGWLQRVPPPPRPKEEENARRHERRKEFAMKTFVVRTVSAAMLAGAMLATGACATQGAGAPGHQSQVDTDLGSASPAHPARTGPLDRQDTAGSKYFPKPATTYERWGLRGMDPSFEEGPGPEGTDLDSIQE